MVTNIERFESLGHNCEFGFFQRHKGVEISSFFRWVYTPLTSLCDIIENDFDGFFELDDLRPRNRTAISDKYDLRYHTRALSTDNVFDDPPETVRTILAHEREKHLHLLAKFRESVADPSRVFVCQQRLGFDEVSRQRLICLFRDRFQGQLLLVGTPDQTGLFAESIETIATRVHVATIEALYPLDPNRNNDAAWDAVLTAFEVSEHNGHPARQGVTALDA